MLEPVRVSSDSPTRTIRADSKAFATRGISKLPRTLDEAMEAFAADPFVKEILGSELRNEFITSKSEEWLQYHQRVSQWKTHTNARMF